MAAPPSILCSDWCEPEDLEACPTCDLDGYTDEQIATAITYASWWLFRASGRRWPGVCEDTVNPCLGVNCWPNGRMYVDGWGYPSIPYHTRAGWMNAWCGDCCYLDCLFLPGPIVSITEVIVDGEVLDPSAYMVKGWAQLCRVDGLRWPVGTNPADGDFQITWERGRQNPPETVPLAALLACARLPVLFCGGADCDDNPIGGVEQISADGTTVNLASLQPTGETPTISGIAIIDEWVRSVNPYGRQRRASVADPLARMRRAAMWT